MDTNLQEAIKLAKLRLKNKKEYEDVMANLFSVHTDFMIFEREINKIYRKLEKKWEEEDK